MRSNCLFYAIGQLIRTWNDGGRLVIRKSHFARMYGIDDVWHPANWVPHFMHEHAGTITHFQPTAAQKKVDLERGVWLTIAARLATLWTFDGEVQRVD